MSAYMSIWQVNVSFHSGQWEDVIHQVIQKPSREQECFFVMETKCKANYVKKIHENVNKKFTYCNENILFFCVKR